MITVKKDFFDTNECIMAKEEALTNENLWKQCKQTDMFVLGNSFLRSFDSGIDYFNNNHYAFKSVNLLKEKLSNIFERVEFTTHFSRPGYQIIKRNFTNKPSVWHYDNVLMKFPYIKEFADYNNNFSDYFEKNYIFTLMLSEAGSFDYFPETKSSFGNTFTEAIENIPLCKSHINLVGDDCISPECTLKEFQSVKYNQGSLLIQEERFLHRVGISDIDNTDSQRITLQSYGVVKNKTLYLFW